MANKNDKHKKNVSGKFYVDSACISCNQCVDVAPDYFKEDSESGTMYVYKQPTDEASTKNCQEALEGCPVDAIGNDG
jgi:ferredoxin